MVDKYIFSLNFNCVHNFSILLISTVKKIKVMSVKKFLRICCDGQIYKKRNRVFRHDMHLARIKRSSNICFRFK